MESKEIIMYDSPEAAQYKTVTGWVGGGRFWGKDEHMARYCGSTHNKCACGNTMSKSYTLCEGCMAKKRKEAYLQLPYKEYDGSPVAMQWGERYFFNEEEIICHLEDLFIEEGIEELELVFCEEQHFFEIDSEIWRDILPEDEYDLPNKMQDAIDALNEVIKSLPPASYLPGKIRTSYKIPDEWRGKNSK